MNKNVYFITLGCPKNRVDSEIMLGKLIEDDFKIVNSPEEAGYLIVNTCAFIGDSKKESIQTIIEMIEQKGTNKKLIVTGCLAQRYVEEIKDELKEVDYFIGTGTFQNIVQIIKEDQRVVVDKPHYLQDFNTPRINTLLPHLAYVKIAEGCSNSCSFCVIPKIRGTQTSRELTDIVKEVKKLADNGVKEINLVAQELTAYGNDLPSKPNLAKLLKELVKINDLKWIRLFYNYPTGFSDELIDLMNSEEKILKYVDLPLQHISDKILKLMFRAGRETLIRNLIEKIKTRINNVSLRGSFIVGFPTEDDDDFNKLVNFVKEVKFEHLGVFKYSKEEQTEAAKFEGQIAQRIKNQRYNIIMKTQKDISKKTMKSYIGKELNVIIDGVSEESDLLLVGRHENQAFEIDGVTYINDGTAKRGEIVKVKVTQSGDYDLVGSIIKS